MCDQRLGDWSCTQQSTEQQQQKVWRFGGVVAAATNWFNTINYDCFLFSSFAQLTEKSQNDTREGEGEQSKSSSNNNYATHVSLATR